MKSLEEETNIPASENEIAELVMDTVFLAMRTIRGEMRSHRPSDLSVPQFRALVFLKRRRGASLSELAEHLGLTLPSTSKMVDGLVKRGLMMRETAADDRRRVTLALTDDGQAAMLAAREATRSRLTGMLSTLSQEQRAELARAMRALRPVLAPGPDTTEQYDERH